MRQRESHESNVNKPDNYWKERVELHIDEKKLWLKEKKELHSEISNLTNKLDMLEKRNKHLTEVINRFGNFGNYDVEFPSPRVKEITAVYDVQGKLVNAPHEEI